MFEFTETHLPIRQDIKSAYRDFWQRLAGAGSWWSGAERVAIAQASRDAIDCSYCKERKQALSPYNFSGEHTGVVNDLPPRAVDAVHRIITDQNRITQQWIEENAAAGLSKEQYVELVGIVVAVFSIDEFHRGLGVPLEPLPEPIAGTPDGYRPAILVEDMGFVPTIPPDGAVGNEADLWQNGATANVLRALTLIPQALRDWLQISSAQYLSIEGMGNFVKDDNRSINRMQMELIAGRVSSYNECFY